MNIDFNEVSEKLKGFAYMGRGDLSHGHHDREAVRYLKGLGLDRKVYIRLICTEYLAVKHRMQDEHLGEMVVENEKERNRADKMRCF